MAMGTDKVASPGALRMTLAFAVFLHHTTNFNLGMSAVLIFFVLSGYWVAAMWRKTYSKTTSAYFTYLVSRIWRIAPVFALCSAIAWALLFWRGDAPAAFGGLMHQLFSNIMILGYNSLPFQANIPGWSLDMELQFYLIAPAIIFLISRNIHLLVICLLISAFAPWFGGSATVAPFLLFFGIGVTAASHELKPSRAFAYRSLYATLATLFLCALIFAKDFMLGESPGQLLAFSDKTNLLIAVMMTPWALYTTRQASASTDRMFGELSYIFYLLHWSVLGALKTGEGSYAERMLLCSEALVIIFVASYLIWRLFDRPINKLRASWVSNRLLAAPVALPAAAPALA
ncbi:acyltransferase [Methylocystis sp. B8]|uniref:acyltransferase family protein n=1 Tax=Methylocystis sp. B8 TaxID=544938 RepID=UPI0010FF5094|nr:acyltransferase [Methylocystis sp. B8]TLG78975.1 acyltransferase [Methylocystis sp. B8]